MNSPIPDTDNVITDYPNWDLQLQQQQDHLEAHRGNTSRTVLLAQPSSTFCYRCHSTTRGSPTFASFLGWLKHHHGATTYSIRTYLTFQRFSGEVQQFIDEGQPQDRLIHIYRTAIELIGAFGYGFRPANTKAEVACQVITLYITTQGFTR